MIRKNCRKDKAFLTHGSAGSQPALPYKKFELCMYINKELPQRYAIRRYLPMKKPRCSIALSTEAFLYLFLQTAWFSLFAPVLNEAVCAHRDCFLLAYSSVRHRKNTRWGIIHEIIFRVLKILVYLHPPNITQQKNVYLH